MKTLCLLFLLISSVAALSVSAQTAAPAPATPAAPPSAPAKRSAAELEKLVAPIALYPDPLLATVLPASVYPLEIVQAARFVADTNNLAKLDEQPWDDSVKAVARIPEAIKKLNEDIAWTIELGDAFLAQDKDLMDAIQSMRGKAQKAGTLQTTPQQVVVVTNVLVEKTIEERVVVVTNTVVQIEPSSSTTVYVPTYNPATVYYPPPAYYANPYPLLTFGAGMAMGAIIANNCDWHYGGCYHGSSININGDVNINRGNINTGNINSGNRVQASGSSQKWQPDQSRLNKSGSPSGASRSAESRGYGSGGSRPSTSSAAARPSTGTGAGGARPSAGAVGGSSSAGSRPTAYPGGSSGGSRPSTSSGVSQSRSTPSAGASRSSASPSVSQSRSSPSGGSSAFSGAGGGGGGAKDYSSRGSSSRSSGGYSGGSRGGGGGRGGGGRR